VKSAFGGLFKKIGITPKGYRKQSFQRKLLYTFNNGVKRRIFKRFDTKVLTIEKKKRSVNPMQYVIVKQTGA
jgi:hypothetical protein